LVRYLFELDVYPVEADACENGPGVQLSDILDEIFERERVCLEENLCKKFSQLNRATLLSAQYFFRARLIFLLHSSDLGGCFFPRFASPIFFFVSSEHGTPSFHAFCPI